MTSKIVGQIGLGGASNLEPHLEAARQAIARIEKRARLPEGLLLQALAPASSRGGWGSYDDGLRGIGALCASLETELTDDDPEVRSKARAQLPYATQCFTAALNAKESRLQATQDVDVQTRRKPLRDLTDEELMEALKDAI